MNRTRGEIGTILSIVSLVVIAGGVAMGNFISSRLSSRVTTTSKAQTPTECRFRTEIKLYKEKRDSDNDLITEDELGTIDIVNDKGDLIQTINGGTGFAPTRHNNLAHYIVDIPNLILDKSKGSKYTAGQEAAVELEGLNKTGWNVKEEFCTTNVNNGVQGCPSIRSLVFYNKSPDRKIEGFRINCGVDITYGWVLTRTKPSDISPTKKPECNCVVNPRTSKGACNATCIDTGRATQSCEPGPTGDTFCQTPDPNKPTSSVNPTSTAPTSSIPTPIPSTSISPTKATGACTCDEPIKPLSGGGGGVPGGTCSSACGTKAGKACAKATEKTDCAPDPTPTTKPSVSIAAANIKLNYDFKNDKFNSTSFSKKIQAVYVGICDESAFVQSNGASTKSLPNDADCRWFKTQSTDKTGWVTGSPRNSGVILGTENIDKDILGNSLELGKQYVFSCLYYYDTGLEKRAWRYCDAQKVSITENTQVEFANILFNGFVPKMGGFLSESTGGVFAYSQGGYTIGPPIGNYITLQYPMDARLVHNSSYSVQPRVYDFRPGVCPADTTDATIDSKCTFFRPSTKTYLDGTFESQASPLFNISMIKSPDGLSLVPLEKGKEYAFTCQFLVEYGIIPVQDTDSNRCRLRKAVFPADGSLVTAKPWANILDNRKDAISTTRQSETHSVIRMREENPGIRIVSLSQQGSTLCDINGDKVCDLKDFNICMSEYGMRTRTSTCDLTNDSHIGAEDLSLVIQ